MSATAGDTQATVSFTAPSDNGSAITGYTVTATDTTTPANGGQTATGSGSPITVTGLTNGDSYTFTVTATNGNGSGSGFGASNAVTPSGLPGAPSGVSATAGDTQATVSFTAPWRQRLGHHRLHGDGHRLDHPGQRWPDGHRVGQPDHGDRPDQR